MMMGTDDLARSCRHTSTPETRGSMRSSSTRSGSTRSKSSRASAPSRATWTRKPSRCSPTVSASTNESSSSTTSTVVESLTELLSSHLGGQGHRPRPRRQAQREHRPLALPRPDLDLAPVVAGHVAHDGEAEPRAPRLPAPGPVDPVEPLEDPLEVPLGDPDAGVRHVDLDPAAVGAGPHRDDRPRVAVLAGVLEQVGHGRDELPAIAPHDVALGHVDVE